MKLHILYEDAHLLVCYKPAGVPVQSAGVGKQDCVSMLKNYLYEQQKNGEPYVGVVHRLDQPVEGILVFAKTPFAARELSRQVTEGTMEKYYLALCRRDVRKSKAGERLESGEVPENKAVERQESAEAPENKAVERQESAEAPENKAGKLSESAKILGNAMFFVDNVDSLVDKSEIYRDFLLKNGKTNTSAVVSPQTKGAKRAELEAAVLMEGEGIKLVRIRLITGRHHQIRVQMAYHGYPLVGDTKYYPQTEEKEDVDKMLWDLEKTDRKGTAGRMPEKSQGVALCAYRLMFFHPKTKKQMDFKVRPEHSLLKAVCGSISFQ